MPDFPHRDIEEEDNCHSEKNGSQISSIRVNKRKNQKSIHKQIGSKVIRTTNPPDVRFQGSFDKKANTTKDSGKDRYPDNHCNERSKMERDYQRKKVIQSGKNADMIENSG